MLAPPNKDYAQTGYQLGTVLALAHTGYDGAKPTVPAAAPYAAI